MVKLFKTFEEEGNKIHNNKFSYIEETFINMTTPMSIKCNIHGIFQQKPCKHLTGQGCAKCIGRGLTKNEFINEALLIHNNKYDYSKTKYINNLTNIIITCKEHGDFLQIPKSHLRGNGCRQCGINNRASLRQKDNDTFISQAIEMHENNYDYSLTNYNKSNIKQWDI